MPEQLNLVREEDGLAQEAFRVLLREGRPLSVTELGDHLGVEGSSVAHTLEALHIGGRAEMNHDGRLLGLFGLTLKPTQHHLELRGTHFFTWCAFDSVGIPAALRESAEIVSECAHCQREIHLAIVGGVSPSAPVVISWRPRQCDSVQEEFCPTVNFFCDEEHFKASGAFAESDGTFLTLQAGTGSKYLGLGCRTQMKITFLWFDDCANHSPARRLLQEVLEERGVRDGAVEINATEQLVAETYRFPGSPTIRIDGEDVEPGFVDSGEYTPRCRLYATASGLSGLPQRRWIEEAMDRAVARK